MKTVKDIRRTAWIWNIFQLSFLTVEIVAVMKELVTLTCLSFILSLLCGYLAFLGHYRANKLAEKERRSEQKKRSFEQKENIIESFERQKNDTDFYSKAQEVEDTRP